ncbi:MAG: hypothetical protein ABJB86_15485 [Bacteroidota bacterium]
MNHHFTITHKDIHIKAESLENDSYVLKYPDSKFIVLNRTPGEWVVEDRSGDYWTDDEIQALGELVNENELAVKEKDDAA